MKKRDFFVVMEIKKCYNTTKRKFKFRFRFEIKTTLKQYSIIIIITSKLQEYVVFIYFKNIFEQIYLTVKLF